jgi:hypothetical protein
VPLSLKTRQSAKPVVIVAASSIRNGANIVHRPSDAPAFVEVSSTEVVQMAARGLDNSGTADIAFGIWTST